MLSIQLKILLTLADKLSWNSHTNLTNTNTTEESK